MYRRGPAQASPAKAHSVCWALIRKGVASIQYTKRDVEVGKWLASRDEVLRGQVASQKSVSMSQHLLPPTYLCNVQCIDAAPCARAPCASAIDAAPAQARKTMLSKLFENYKVIGAGKGGAELFAQLGLQIGDPHGMHGQSARVEVEIPKLLRSPFSVPGQDKVVDRYAINEMYATRVHLSFGASHQSAVQKVFMVSPRS
jgi:hypothetical protein